MKGRQVSYLLIVFFLLALVLIATGFLFSIHIFSYVEEIVLTSTAYQELVDSVHATAFQSMICGSMVVVGIGLLVLCILHLFQSTVSIHREAKVLQEKQKAMEELLKKTRSLAHHQRLETLGTLTSSIAHEFNNLLTPIMGYTLMALEKLHPEEELYDDLLEVYQSSKKAKEIISRLSDLSRKNTDATFRQISPDALIQKTLDVVMPAKPDNIEINLNLNCWDQRITANEIQISQMMLNLILNAFQAMGDGPGVLTVGTSIDERNISIQVKDTGCGIPKDMQSKIFEPFFTTKETGKGTGLGLAIVAQVVEEHKGKIRVRSTVGEGTTMTVRIPRSRNTDK